METGHAIRGKQEGRGHGGREAMNTIMIELTGPAAEKLRRLVELEQGRK